MMDATCGNHPKSQEPSVPALSSPLLTVRQAAELCGAGRSTVYVWMDSGALPYVKIGRSRRIRREALENFVASHDTGGWVADDQQ